MKVYLAILILNFVDYKFIPTVELFKYSIIGLLHLKALIAITSCSSVVLGWLSISTKISVVAFGSKKSIWESLSIFAFSSRGICIN